MAIIKTYPLKSNYYGPDRLILSDMEPDDLGVVHGATKSLTLSSLKSFIGSGSSSFTLVVDRTSGAATFDTNTNILNIPDYSIANPVDGSGTAGRIPKWSDSNTLNDSQIFQSSSSIGIGTVNPTGSLEVYNGALNNQLFITCPDTSQAAINFGGISAKTKGKINYSDNSDVMMFHVNSSERMRITSSGDVGIGTTSPNDGDLTIGTPKLHVAVGGTSGTFNLAARFQSTTTDADNTGTSILINSSNDRGLLIKAGRKDSDREVAYFDVVSNSGNTTNMLSMGKYGSAYNVGIGTTSPSAKLDVAGSMNVKGIATLKGDGTNDGKLRLNCSANSHYVEIVGPTHSGGSSYSLKLPNSLPNVSAQILQSNASGVLGWIPTPSGGGGGGGGTITSVGLTMPSSFQVTGSPLSGTGGTISVGVTGGNAGEYLDYQGNWSTPTDTNSTYSLGTGASAGQIILTGSNPSTSQTVTVAGTNGISITQFTSGTFNVNLNLATSSARGGVKIGFTESGKNYPVELSSEKMFVNVPWTDTNTTNITLTTTGTSGAASWNGTTLNIPQYSSGSGGGISFSGTTSGGLATYTNSSTAGVSSKVTLNASGLMQFDADNAGGSRASIDYNPTGNRLQIGDFSGGSAIVELYTDGNRQFQIGVSGEIGLGTGASQGTNGQVLTSQGNGSPAYWTNKTTVPSNVVTGSGTIYEVPMWNPQSGTTGSYIGAGGGFASSPFKSNSSGQSIISTEVNGGISFRNGTGQIATINGGTSSGAAYQINLPGSGGASSGKVLAVSGVSGGIIATSWQTVSTSSVNIGNTNLSLTSARTLDLDGYDLQFRNSSNQLTYKFSGQNATPYFTVGNSINSLKGTIRIEGNGQSEGSGRGGILEIEAGEGNGHVQFKGPESMNAGSYAVTLPSSLPASNVLLTGDQQGNLSWNNGTNLAFSSLKNTSTGTTPAFIARSNNSSSVQGWSDNLGALNIHNSNSSTSSTQLAINCPSKTGVNYAVSFYYNSSSGSGAQGSITVSGTSVSYNTSSDYRLKENIVEMTGAVDRVKQLKPSRFNFIAEPSKIVDGFLAHEVSSIVPEAVIGEKDGEMYQGIDQSKIVPLLVGAIKELTARIEALEA